MLRDCDIPLAYTNNYEDLMKELESGSKPAGGSDVSHTSFSPWLPRGWGVRSRGDSAVATEPSWSNVAKRSGKSDKARECDFIWNTVRESVSSDPEAAPIQNEAGSAIVATEHDATARKSVIDDEGENSSSGDTQEERTVAPGALRMAFAAPCELSV